jgi:glycosyltransferase involved in cell wall biosynthesis
MASPGPVLRDAGPTGSFWWLTMSADYLLAVQAAAFPVSPTAFATESAFAQHLRELRAGLGEQFDRLVLVAPCMTEEQYEAQKAHLGIVDLQADGVAFLPAHTTATTPWGFWRREVGRIWREVGVAVSKAAVVHSGMSTDLWRPLMGLVNLRAWWAGRPVIFIVDIDFRQHSKRYHRLGLWGLRSYCVNRLLYDPLKWMQVWLAPRMFQLVLLKSASMVQDFGRGRPNVRNFYDTVHGPDDVLDDLSRQARLEWLKQDAQTLEVVFFGRLVPYKGLDRAIEAVRLAGEQGCDVRLTLIGEGDCLTSLRRQVAQAGLNDRVRFEPPVPYGAALFERLAQAHVCVACPLVEDTPRAAFDAMARGLPLVAFDITYFRDLAQQSGAVALAQWPSAQSLADQFKALHANRARLAEMADRGLTFARQNTQAYWLARRRDWMLELLHLPGAQSRA